MCVCARTRVWACAHHDLLSTNRPLCSFSQFHVHLCPSFSVFVKRQNWRKLYRCPESHSGILKGCIFLPLTYKNGNCLKNNIYLLGAKKKSKMKVNSKHFRYYILICTSFVTQHMWNRLLISFHICLSISAASVQQLQWSVVWKNVSCPSAQYTHTQHILQYPTKEHQGHQILWSWR